MAERFKEVLEVAIAATEDPSLKALLTTVGKLGDTGEIADEKLVELVETLTRVSQVDKAVSAFEALTQSQTDLADAAERAGLRLKLAAEQEADAASVLADKRAALEALKAQQDAYAASAERQVLVERELKQAVRDAGAEVRTAQQAWREAGTVLASASKDYDRTVESQGRLQAQLAPLARDIEAAGLSTQNLAAAQATLRQSSEQARSGIESIVQAAQAAAQAETALGEAAEDSGERIREVVRASLERSNAEKAALAARQQAVAAEREVQAAVVDTADATERVAAGQDALRASANAIINDLRDYEEVLRRGATSVEEIADQEQRLDRLFQAGAITIEEQSDALAKLTKDEEALARAADLAAREQAKLTRETAAAGSEADRAGGRVDRFTQRLKQLAAGALAYLSLRKLKDTLVDILQTGDRFEKLDQQLGVVFGSIEDGEAALERFRDIASRTPNTLEDIVKAGIDLKNRGLDPFNGSLEAILNQTAALGGEQQKLETISRALGNAWAKQKLQAEQINQLIEAGVPVYQLLADATGRSATEVQRLAAEGDLGRESISALFSAMSAANAGAAAQGVTGLTSLWSKLREEVDSFFTLIARGGALDFFKQQLTDLRERIRAMAENGELEALARRMSDSIVSIATAVRSGVEFIGRYSREIATLGAAFVAAKIAELATSAARGIGLLAVGIRGVLGPVGLVVGGLTTLVVWLRSTKDDAEKADPAIQALAESLDLLTKSTDENRVANENAAAVRLESLKFSNQIAQASLAEAEAEFERARQLEESLALEGRAAGNRVAKVRQLGEEVVALRRTVEAQNAAIEAGEQAIERSRSLAKAQNDAAGSAGAAAAAAEELERAYQSLGITSKASLDRAAESARNAYNAIVEGARRGEAAQEDVTRAFDVYAEARRRAVADSTAAARAEVEAQLTVERAALDASKAVDKIGDAGRRASEVLIRAMEAARSSLAAEATRISQGLSDALEKGLSPDKIEKLRSKSAELDTQINGVNDRIRGLKEGLAGAGDEGERRTNQLRTGLVDVSKGAKDAGEQVAGAFNRVGAAQALRDAITAVAQEFYGLSDAAGQFFEQSLLDFARGERTILGVFDAINQAQAATRDAYTEQQEAAARQAQAFANLSDEAVERMVRSGVTADALQAKAGRLSQIFDLLGEQDLSGLRSALSAAASQVDALRGKAEGALESLRRMNDELEAERLRAEGDEAAIAARERDRRLQQIQDELEAAGAAGNELAARNRQLAEEAYRRRLQEIEDERRRRLQVEDEVAGRRRGNESSGAGAGAGGGGSGAAAGSGASGRGPGTGQGGQPVVINIGGERLSLNLGGSNDVATLQRLIALLRRDAMASGLGGSALR